MPSSPPIVVRGEWKEADDAYHRFDEKESGKAKWLLLKITTEPLGAGSSEDGICAICLTSYSSEGCSSPVNIHTTHGGLQSGCHAIQRALCVVLWQI